MPTLTRRRVILGRSSAFTPAKISNLEGWFESSAIAGVTDGGAVATWRDLSGYGRDLSQGTGANQPLLRTTSGPNSTSFVDFDGTNDYLQSAAFGAAISQPITVVMVGRLDTNPGIGAQRRFFDGASDAQMVFYANNVAGTTSWSAFAGSGLADGTTDTGVWHVFAITFNNASSKIRIDGGAGTSGTTGTNSLGAFTFGNNGAGGTTRVLDGGIAAAAIYSKSLSLAELDLVGRYFAAPRNLTWTAAA